MTVLPGLLVLKHDDDTLANLALHDLDAFILTFLRAAAGAVVGRDLCRMLSTVLLRRWLLARQCLCEDSPMRYAPPPDIVRYAVDLGLA